MNGIVANHARAIRWRCARSGSRPAKGDPFPRRCGAGFARRPAGFTLVELVLSLAILGMLVALLLVTVQRSREAARQVRCTSNLRQLALASEIHLTRNGYFVSNGWGFQWGPEAGRGVGPEQPAGWIYQLAFEVDPPAAESFTDPASREAAHPYLSIVRCPTRAAPRFGPATPMVSPVNYQWQPTVPKSDYAINGGDRRILRADGGPASLDRDVLDRYDWGPGAQATGISYQRSRVRPGMVCDGLSHTYLIGEKHVFREAYHTAEAFGYNLSCWSGVNRNLTRWTNTAPIPDAWHALGNQFGSAHAGIWHVAFCDGSVRKLTYDINHMLHQKNGHRCDRGSVVADPFGG